MRRAATNPLTVCLNCSTDLHIDGPEAPPANFCPRCGQHNHTIHIPFTQILREVVQDALQFDSQTWHTVRALLTSPGELTRAFNHGHRVEFLPPMRLYGFASFLFFFLLSYEAADTPKAPVHVRQPTKDGVLAKGAVVTDDDDEETKDEEVTVDQARDSVRAAFNHKKARISLDGVNELSDKDLLNDSLISHLAKGEQPYTDSVIRARHGTPSFLKRLSYRQTARLVKSQEGLSDQFIRNASIGMFFLMPLFALLLKLFYRRQHPYYVPHLVCSIHLHSFYFLFFSVLLGLDLALPESWDIPSVVVLLISWVYWVLSLKRFSGQSFKRSFWKGALLFGGYVTMLVFYSVGVILASLLLF